MTLPSGKRYMILSAISARDRQYRGILDICRELSGRGFWFHHPWEGQTLDLSQRRDIEWVLISGHGSPHRAAFGSQPLLPSHLRLPQRAYLLLLGCHQGRQDLRIAWSRGTGAALPRVLGCAGETESAFSTLFFLHVLAGGQPLYWFRRWREANDRFRPYFPEARGLYKANGGRYGVTLDHFRKRGQLKGLEDFFLYPGLELIHLDGLA
jgi:hypothetical protein